MGMGHLGTHKKTHTGDKPYENGVCNKRFARLDHLGTHERTHTGYKHECDVCNRRFLDTINLARHKRTHSGDKPYECDVARVDFHNPET